LFNSQIPILLAHEHDGSGAERANLLHAEHDGEQGDHHEDVEIVPDGGCQPRVGALVRVVDFCFSKFTTHDIYDCGGRIYKIHTKVRGRLIFDFTHMRV